MQINTKAWWYRLPSTFNDRLRNYSPRDVCSLMRSLLAGWLAVLTVVTMATSLAVVMLGCIAGYWMVVFGMLPEEHALDMLFLGSVFQLVVYSILTNIAMDYYGINRKWNNYVEDRKYNKVYRSKKPGLVSSWLKGLKDKTCALIEYI